MERIVYFDNRKELKLILDKLENEYDYSNSEKEEIRKNKLIGKFIDKL